jgi:hypothetical protein
VSIGGKLVFGLDLVPTIVPRGGALSFPSGLFVVRALAKDRPLALAASASAFSFCCVALSIMSE